MRTRKHFRQMRTALSEVNMKAQGIERAEILVVLREEDEGAIANTARKNARRKCDQVMNRLMVKRVADALGKIGRGKEVKFGAVIVGQAEGPFWTTTEAKDLQRSLRVETADLRGVRIMAKEDLLQRLRKRDCSSVFKDSRSTEFTTEFAKRLVACLDKKEDEVDEVRQQEEGDLIEKRMKEKKRSQMEKGASSSGSQGDRSGRTKKGRKEKEIGKEGDPIDVDSDSDTAERETYHKAEIKKKDLKEREQEVVVERKSILDSLRDKFQRWSGGDKPAPEKPKVEKSLKEQQEDYKRKL